MRAYPPLDCEKEVKPRFEGKIKCINLNQLVKVVRSLTEQGLSFNADAGSLTITLTGGM